ncbi:MAG TPA: hypothetical protein VMT17_17055 [Anaeromyxobacteraceae bacterium]|nr:hypothetical protein [Anaeromyxobacteraceae bacterium]
MNRTPLFAALALAAGCYSSPPPPSLLNLNIYWGFLGWQGQPAFGNFSQTDPGCSQANVDQVYVSITGPGGYTQDENFPCVQPNGVPGVQYADVYAGTYSWTLYGSRNGVVVYSVTETNQNVAPDSTGNATFESALEALYPNLNVSYTLPATCAGPPAIAQMSFQLDLLGSVYYANAGTTFFPLACGANSSTIVVPALPANSYVMNFVRALDANGTSQYQVCGQTVVQAPGNVSGSASVTLSTTPCP